MEYELIELYICSKINQDRKDFFSPYLKRPKVKGLFK